MTSYNRVLPRDLFNEGKLLKCLGRLVLLIHDGKTARWPAFRFDHEFPAAGFQVAQNPHDGGLYCVNLTFELAEIGTVHVHSNYNSKADYPLSFADWDGGTGPVFDDEGGLSDDFVGFLDRATGLT